MLQRPPGRCDLAAETPRIVVTGELIHFSDMMNRAAAMMYVEFDDLLRVRCSHGFFGLAALEHLQHAVGDEKSADDVAERSGNGHECRARWTNWLLCSSREDDGRNHSIASSAFVSDISGVCKSGETRRITSSPKTRREETHKSW